MLTTLYPGGLLNGRTAASLLLPFILTLLAVTYSSGQRFNDVVFGKLPQDYQLYPRDQNSEAKIPLAGVVETGGWNYVSVQVQRNGQPFQYRRAAITYGAGAKGAFSTEATIRAERANYDFKVYLCKNNDSTLLVTRTRVVSGDVYILSGQSNSTGFFGESDTSMFCRTFGKITDNLNTAPYNAADTLWTLSNMHYYNNGVGTMGLEIQKQLMEKSGIPNCLINAGFHWSSAYAHSRRTEGNPTDFNTGYGRMLYRAQKAGVAGAVKAYIFRQGESEAYHEGGDWPGNFDVLYKYLKMDFPSLQKYYVFQIDIIYWPSLVGPLLRDYQRRLPDIYPDVVSLATVGTQGFDGLHYSREGNRQGGTELSRLMLRDLYAATDTSNINSPDIKKAFYHSAAKDKLTLVFDPGQQLIYPEPFKHPNGPVLDPKDFFLVGGQSGSVAAGRADGNRIVLDLTRSQNATTLHYLPLYVEQGGPWYPFLGPYVTNARGMRAFTFFDFPIGMALSIPTLAAKQEEAGPIRLTWAAVPEATGYVLERKMADATAFTPIARLQANALTWNDEPGETTGKITYRLFAFNNSTESAEPAYAEIAPSIVLGTEKEPGALFSIYPNPAQRGEEVTIRFPAATSGQISLLNMRGQSVSQKRITGSGESKLRTPELSSGMHLIRFRSGDRVFTRKLLIK